MPNLQVLPLDPLQDRELHQATNRDSRDVATAGHASQDGTRVPHLPEKAKTGMLRVQGRKGGTGAGHGQPAKTQTRRQGCEGGLPGLHRQRITSRDQDRYHCAACSKDWGRAKFNSRDIDHLKEGRQKPLTCKACKEEQKKQV